MLQIQYLNQPLKKTQIERIISNYNIKFSTIKKEINVKIDKLIEVILKDITQIFEGIQQVSKEKDIQKEYEKAKKEIQFLNVQLQEKRNNESKLKNEIEELKLKNQQKDSKGIYLQTEPKNKNILPSKKKRNNGSLPKYFNSPKTVRTGKNISCKKMQTVNLKETEEKSTKISNNVSLYQTEKGLKNNQKEKTINNEKINKTYKLNKIEQRLKYKTAKKDKNTRKSIDLHNTSNYITNFIEEEQEENGGKSVSTLNIFDMRENFPRKEINFVLNDYKNIINEEDDLLQDEEEIIKKLLEKYE
jgi:hypothetical protein